MLHNNIPANKKAVTKKRGFTLIELMVTMVIIAILAGMGTAALRSTKYITQDTVQTLATDFISVLHAARAMTIRAAVPYQITLTLRDKAALPPNEDDWMVQRATVGHMLLAERAGIPINYGDDTGAVGQSIQSIFKPVTIRNVTIWGCLPCIGAACATPATNPAPDELTEVWRFQALPSGILVIRDSANNFYPAVTCYIYVSNIVAGYDYKTQQQEDFEANPRNYWMVEIDGLTFTTTQCPGWNVGGC